MPFLIQNFSLLSANKNFIMELVLHCNILQTINAAFKALQFKAIALSNASKRLQDCLEKLEQYRHEFGH